MEDIRTNDGLTVEEAPKKKRKNLAAVLIAVGVVLFLIGWLMGARGANIGWYNGRLRFIAAIGSEEIVIQERVDDIRITARSANIEFIAHSGSEVIVNLIGIEADVDVTGNALVINAANNRSLGIINSVSPIIRVSLPYNHTIRADAQSSSGRIITNDLNFENLNLRTSSGSIRLNNTVAGADLNSSSGSIRLNRVLTHDMNINSSSGSIRLYDMSVTGTLSATSSSGSIRGEDIDMQLQSLMDLRSSSGSVTISLNNRDVLYSLSSRSGSQRVNGVRHHGRNTIDSSPNRSIPQVIIQTASGSIRLNTSN